MTALGVLELVTGGSLRSRSSGRAVGSPVPAHCGRAAFHDPVHGSPSCWNGSPCGAKPDELEEQLLKQLAEVPAERDELAVAERVLERVSEQIADERASASPALGRWVDGR